MPCAGLPGREAKQPRYQTHTDLSHLAALLRRDPGSLQVLAAKAGGAADLLAGSQAASSSPGWCSLCSTCSPFPHLSYKGGADKES